MPRSTATVALRAFLAAALLLGPLPSPSLAASSRALDRLTGAQPNGTSGYTETYAYNAIGNLTSKNGASYTYGDSAHKHAVTAAGGSAFTYDANGNMLTRPGQTLAWDAENRLASVTQGGVTTTFTYNGDGNRVKVAVGSVVTAFVGSLYEVNPGTGVTATYYYAGSQRVAMRKAAGVTWLTGDHLGSASLATNAGGAVVSQERYYPYGATRSGGVPTEYRFTGQKLDTGTGLYYYGARYYDPVVGRFISADTVVPGAGKPQALNRYAYSLNNPARYRDPTGHWFETAWDLLNIGWDIREVQQDPSFLNIAALLVDVGAAVLPAVPGGAGLLVRGGKGAKVAAEATEAAKAAAKRTGLVAGAERAYDAARNFNYRGAFFAANPALRAASDQIMVHHSVPLEVLLKRPGAFAAEELNAASNLRGIPVRLNEQLHLSDIHGQLWQRFWNEYPDATRDQILEFAQRLDERFNLPNLPFDDLIDSAR